MSAKSTPLSVPYDPDPLERRGPPIWIDDVEMVYTRGADRVHALRKVRLEIPSGQLLVVRGRSGSGKTTLLHLLAGLRRPTSGRILIDDTDLAALSESEADRFRRRHIGLVFQFFNLIPSLDVEMNIALPLLLEGHRLPDLRAEIGELVSLLGLAHRRTHAPHELSGGEMQRVAIARALIVRPKLILADEPTGNLDSRTADDVYRLLREATRERAVTTVIMSHEVDAIRYADRTVVMNDGEVVEDTGLVGA